jgi:hypothetical protein
MTACKKIIVNCQLSIEKNCIFVFQNKLILVVEMKLFLKILLGILFLIVAGVAFIIYEEVSFNPLEQKDFQKLFKNFNGSFRKSCSKDFIGFSIHGEIFDMYRYKISGAVIDGDFPKITKWENKEISEETQLVGKWRNCPLDAKTEELYYILTVSDFNNVKCGISFKKELLNPKNYYSYIHFPTTRQYFLLYCTESREFYYIRKYGL